MLLQECRWMLVGVGIGLLLTMQGCGGRVVVEVAGEPSSPPPSSEEAGRLPTESRDAGTPDACVATAASDEACWGRPPYAWRLGPVTSVDYARCSDDGRAFVDAVADAGGDCWRPSNREPSATVWCCVYLPSSP